MLIASIMEEYNRGPWEELIGKCEEVGVDAFEINFSCPHGMPERKMGMAMGQDCTVLQVCVYPQAAGACTRLQLPAHAQGETVAAEQHCLLVVLLLPAGPCIATAREAHLQRCRRHPLALVDAQLLVTVEQGLLGLELLRLRLHLDD